MFLIVKMSVWVVGICWVVLLIMLKFFKPKEEGFQPLVTERERYNAMLSETTRNRVSFLCCKNDGCTKAMSVELQLRVHDLEDTFTSIMLEKNCHALLYYQPLVQFEGIPTFNKEPFQISSNDSFNKRETPRYTHIVTSRSLTGLQAFKIPDVTCKPLNVALTTNKWAGDLEKCLPDALKGPNCGLETMGFRQGNYMGIPTMCFDHVGSTLQDVGLKDERGIQGGAFIDPGKALFTDSQDDAPQDDVYIYPMGVPVYVEYTHGRQRVAINPYRGLAANEKECESVYVCSVNDKDALNVLLESIQETDLETCRWESTTCSF